MLEKLQGELVYHYPEKWATWRALKSATVAHHTLTIETGSELIRERLQHEWTKEILDLACQFDITLKEVKFNCCK